MMSRNIELNSTVLKGALAGFVGGLAASWTMNQLMTLVALTTQGSEHQDLDPQRSKQLIAERKRQFHQLADPTGEVSDSLAKRFLGRRLTRRELEISGPVAHYAFGALAGGAYGALVQFIPRSRLAHGVAFGLALWILGDEIAVPALGLSEKPQRVPLEAHAAMFASHIVYGYTLETVRKRAMDLAA